MSMGVQSNFLQQIRNMNASADNMLYMSRANDTTIKGTTGAVDRFFTRSSSFKNAARTFLNGIRDLYGAAAQDLAKQMIRDAGETDSKISINTAKDILMKFDNFGNMETAVVKLEALESQILERAGERKESHQAGKVYANVLAEKLGEHVNKYGLFNNSQSLIEGPLTMMKDVADHLCGMLKCLHMHTKEGGPALLLSKQEVDDLVDVLTNPKFNPKDTKIAIMAATKNKLEGKRMNPKGFSTQLEMNPGWKNSILRDKNISMYFS